MAKYDPLRRYLRRRRDDPVQLTFAEIEQIIGDILPHAADHPTWWGNSAGAGRGQVQCAAWLEAGFHATPLEASKAVRFERIRQVAPRDGGA